MIVVDDYVSDVAGCSYGHDVVDDIDGCAVGCIQLGWGYVNSHHWYDGRCHYSLLRNEW